MFKKMLFGFATLSLVACGASQSSRTLEAPAATEASATETLTSPTELQWAVKLVDRVKTPLNVSGPCTSMTVTVREQSCGMSPAKWSAVQGDDLVPLENNEISGAIALFNRLNVKLQGNSACTHSEVTVNGKSCGFTPMKWTVTYLKN